MCGYFILLILVYDVAMETYFVVLCSSEVMKASVKTVGNKIFSDISVSTYWFTINHISLNL